MALTVTVPNRRLGPTRINADLSDFTPVTLNVTSSIMGYVVDKVASVVVTDTAGAANKYTFTVDASNVKIRITGGNTTLLVPVATTALPTGARLPTSNLTFAVSTLSSATPAVPDSGTSAAVPVAFARTAPLVSPNFHKIKLNASKGDETVIRVPATGLAPVDADIGAKVVSSAGSWRVKSAKQKRNFVKLVVVCEAIDGIEFRLMSTAVAAASSMTTAQSNFLITLYSDENDVVEVPAVEAEFVDPDSNP